MNHDTSRRKTAINRTRGQCIGDPFIYCEKFSNRKYITRRCTTSFHFSAVPRYSILIQRMANSLLDCRSIVLYNEFETNNRTRITRMLRISMDGTLILNPWKSIASVLSVCDLSDSKTLSECPYNCEPSPKWVSYLITNPWC